MLKIVVVIPTNHRPEEFLRAIDSVSSQTRMPDHVIVVHEEGDSYAMALEGNGYHITENRRTKSLSGAINHALDEVVVNRHDWGIDPLHTWLALLDDDDWWSPEYLEKCASLAVGRCRQVVSGLVRYDELRPEGFNLSIPTELDCVSFLTGNPHVQGSNLFVRMDSFLEAGGFDEALLSCTDRDFCIRLFEGGAHEWARLDEHLVHHDARRSGRISDPGSDRKRQGITGFAMKHQFRMSDEVWEDFLKISKDRFGVVIDSSLASKESLVDTTKRRGSPLPVESLEIPYDLTIGVTFGDLCLVGQFAESLQRVVSEWPHRVRLVACLHNLAMGEVMAVLNNVDSVNLDVSVYDEESSIDLARSGSLGPWFVDEGRRNGASWGRCVLHRRLLDEVGGDSRPVIWIVDEDMLLHEGEAENGGGTGADMLLRAVSLMEDRSIDVGVGHVIGDPPVPPMFTLRSQLIDLYYSNLSKEGGAKIRMSWSPENLHDIHHDLSTDRFDHIEFPWGMFNIKSDEESLKKIHGGRYFSRPVHSDWMERVGSDLIVRGGNTIVLDPNVLGEWSNVAPYAGGIQSRRGDSMWCLYSQRIGGKTVGKERRRVSWIPFAVPQSRAFSKLANDDIENLRGDIMGSMIMRVLGDIFPPGQMSENRKIWERGGWESYLSERVIEGSLLREARLISNLYRANKIERLLGTEETHKETLDCLYRDKMAHAAGAELELFFDGLPQNMTSFRSAQPKIRPQHKIADAIVALGDYGDYAGAEVMGHGSEGVVFRKDGVAIKVHHEGQKLERGFIEIISKLGEQGVDCLPNNFTILNNCDPSIVTYDWVEGSHPDFKTSASPWLDMLREAKERGFVYWDLKPLNLILTEEGGLVIIDLGRDLRTFEEGDWESMVRKAYLCWKHWDSPLLRTLLTKSVKVSDPSELPELEGIDLFKKAIEIQDKSDLHDPWFLDFIGSNSKGKMLDWGCGSGRLTKQIASLGFDIDAYDPIVEHRNKVVAHPHINWVNGPECVEEGAYPIAISNLVLCDIECDEEAYGVLSVVSRSLAPGGKCIITVCNPESIHITCTSTIQRQAATLVDGKASYDKKIRSTGRVRLEHTRSESRIVEMAERAGLELSHKFRSSGVNADDCTPISEYLGLEFTKVIISGTLGGAS